MSRGIEHARSAPHQPQQLAAVVEAEREAEQAAGANANESGHAASSLSGYGFLSLLLIKKKSSTW